MPNIPESVIKERQKASCITDEMENRLSTSMTVRQKYITANITSRDSEKKKFVNRLRVIMKLA